ncbi:MAG: hypothetical protein V1754_07905 [Pseudomonadota bacterium]
MCLEVVVPHGPESIAEQVVLGIVGGGFLGPGLLITRREADRIEFRRVSGMWERGPDKGEIALGKTITGTVVSCCLWNRRMRVRRLILSALFGLALIGIALTSVNCFGYMLLPVAVLVAFVGGVWGWRADCKRQKQMVDTYLQNSRYLRRM